MKIPRTLSLLLGALLGAAVLLAQNSTPAAPVNAAHHDHEDMGYVAGPVVQKFENKTLATSTTPPTVVTVTWTYLGQEGTWPNVTDRYRCVIHQDAEATTTKGYSLYNLQIQGRRWETQVHVVSGTQVDFTPGMAASIPDATWPDGRPFKRVPMVARGPWNPNSPDTLGDDRVGYIKFKGADCTLEIVSKRRRHGQMMSFQPGMVILTSHDATPPPGGGGGEN